MPATEQQINANRENAKLSSGPANTTTTSQNALKHGFTGLTIVISDAERAAYETHVEAYTEQCSPNTHEETHLVQQLADHHWTLHQIGVQQISTISQMNAATAIMSAAGDPVATAALLASLSRTLNTLGIYESRRRRAATALREELDTLQREAAERFQKHLSRASLIYKAAKESGVDWDPQKFGFVCSADDVRRHLQTQEMIAEVRGTENSDVPQPSL